MLYKITVYYGSLKEEPIIVSSLDDVESVLTQLNAVDTIPVFKMTHGGWLLFVTKDMRGNKITVEQIGSDSLDELQDEFRYTRYTRYTQTEMSC